MKIIYTIVSFISGFLALDIILSFLGLSPLNEGSGFFLSTDVWHFVLITSVVIFGVSTAKLLNKKQPNPNSPRPKLFLLGLGICLILGALPAGFMTEISVNGCCGASGGNYTGIGYVLMGVMVVSGVAAIIFAVKHRPKTVK